MVRELVGAMAGGKEKEFDLRWDWLRLFLNMGSKDK